MNIMEIETECQETVVATKQKQPDPWLGLRLRRYF